MSMDKYKDNPMRIVRIKTRGKYGYDNTFEVGSADEVRAIYKRFRYLKTMYFETAAGLKGILYQPSSYLAVPFSMVLSKHTASHNIPDTKSILRMFSESKGTEERKIVTHYRTMDGRTVIVGENSHRFSADRYAALGVWC